MGCLAPCDDAGDYTGLGVLLEPAQGWSLSCLLVSLCPSTVHPLLSVLAVLEEQHSALQPPMCVGSPRGATF